MLPIRLKDESVVPSKTKKRFIKLLRFVGAVLLTLGLLFGPLISPAEARGISHLDVHGLQLLIGLLEVDLNRSRSTLTIYLELQGHKA